MYVNFTILDTKLFMNVKGVFYFTIHDQMKLIGKPTKMYNLKS